MFRGFGEDAVSSGEAGGDDDLVSTRKAPVGNCPGGPECVTAFDEEGAGATSGVSGVLN
jgi:hypothetical protein